MPKVDNEKYSRYRQELYDFVKQDLEGPFSEDEVIDESPIQKYSTGIVFAQAQTENDEDSSGLDMRTRDDEEINAIDMSSTFFPSAMGLSFSVAGPASDVSVSITYGAYKKLSAKDFDKVKIKAPSLKERIESNTSFKNQFELLDNDFVKLSRALDEHDRDVLLSFIENDNPSRQAVWQAFKTYQNGWYREQKSHETKIELKVGYSELEVKDHGFKLGVTAKKVKKTNNWVVTLSVVNSKKVAKPQSEAESALFQVNLSVAASSVFADLNHSDIDPDWFEDEEEKSLNLLYHKKHVYGVGHGISADWNVEDGKVKKVYTTTLPQFAVPQMEFNLPSDGGELPDLSISTYAFNDLAVIAKNLDLLARLYGNWIDDIKTQLSKLPASYHSVGNKHIADCESAKDRILKGIELLKKDKNVFQSFQHANEAMLMQRAHTRLQADKSMSDEAPGMPTNYSKENDTWRPFQIAFLVMNLISMADPKSSERDVVDLIWFPTGGGKTEAYLALTAYTIFLRRLSNPEASGGTTVIMRYTLRLLTSQQFQRACTLICACETLRKNTGLYGEEEISVGLWLGSASTPNNLNDAKHKIGELQRNSFNAKNPFQVLNCPWCGTHMTKINGKGMYCYALKSKPKRFYMWCPNSNCAFSDHNGGLPIKIIDEDIYNSPPTLLFGTVDKFAMLPWKKEASTIFGINTKNDNMSPSLIIQDELHLISGSLGTMVGIYETAIDMLCSSKGTKPKIIASTATIRKAKEQCLSLYSRKVAQFPSPGIDAADSFFAREAEINEKTPGRLYVGVMPSGKTSTTMQVRLMADTIQGVEFIDDTDQIKDGYWTQVVYCNSIRELGSSKSVIYDDVKEYSQNLARYHSKKQRYYSDHNVQELTSRISAEKIPEILRQLENHYPEKDAIDVLLATNMISVGVDIDRLGLMIVLGQPKTTSEYIQASSRVGRSHPGIVFTLYSPVKSRDRSHFEQFVKYHQSLYRHVEPTSVTPFSAPVRDKALHALLFTLIRHMLGLREDADLKDFDKSSAEYQAILDKLLQRVKTIDPLELLGTEEEVTELSSRLEELINYADLTYAKTKDKDKAVLMKPAQDIKDKGEYRTPQSMRSTDAECYVTLDYS